MGNNVSATMYPRLPGSYEHGELSNSQKQAIITLIKKKDRDRWYIKNWRPIPLLNVDVKIASRALAICLANVLPPCIQLASGKFELTNQDSAGGKKFTVLPSM